MEERRTAKDAWSKIKIWDALSQKSPIQENVFSL